MTHGHTINGLRPGHVETLAAITDHITRHGETPRPADIAHRLGVHVTTVRMRLAVLAARGYIRLPGSRYTRMTLTGKPVGGGLDA